MKRIASTLAAGTAGTSLRETYPGVLRELKASEMELARLKTARHRLETRKARTDIREWQIKRRSRTRQLIELGDLVVKAGLVDLADHDRATLYGAFLTVAAKLRGEERE